jgi:hypothetical protein
MKRICKQNKLWNKLNTLEARSAHQDVGQFHRYPNGSAMVRAVRELSTVKPPCYETTPFEFASAKTQGNRGEAYLGGRPK